MTTVTIENVNTDKILNIYYVKYLISTNNKKNIIKNKLDSIASKYYKKWNEMKNISDINKLIYLK